MTAIDKIRCKYKDSYPSSIKSVDDVNNHTLDFCQDVATIFRIVTLQRNVQKHPVGYGLNDAPIVGLLTRIAKLLKLVTRLYALNNGEYLSIFSRTLVEASIVATYLLKNGDNAVTDFRLCSYKDTLRIIRDQRNGLQFFQTQSGQRVLRSAHKALVREYLDESSFAVQKKNRWRLEGKSLYDIFTEVAGTASYPFIYGMMSESIHASWNESMDWCLSRKSDGNFSVYSLFHPADVRLILPLLVYATPPYVLWLERTEMKEASIAEALDWIQRYSRSLFEKFDELYDE